MNVNSSKPSFNLASNNSWQQIQQVPNKKEDTAEISVPTLSDDDKAVKTFWNGEKERSASVAKQIADQAFKSIEESLKSSDLSTLTKIVALRDGNQDTILHQAVLSKSVEKVNLALKADSKTCKDPDHSLIWSQNANGDSPLHLAAELEDSKIMELLVTYMKEGVTKDIPWKTPQNKQGRTPLHNAAEKGNLTIVKLVEDLPIRMTINDGTVVCIGCIQDNQAILPEALAATKGQTDVVLFLDKFGGELLAKLAMQNGHIETAIAILKNSDLPIYQLILDEKNRTLIDTARKYDQAHPEAKLEQKLLQSIKPEVDFVDVCKKNSHKIEHWLAMSKVPHLNMGALRQFEKRPDEFATGLLQLVTEPTRSLLKSFYDPFKQFIDLIFKKMEPRPASVGESRPWILKRFLLDQKDHLSNLQSQLNGLVRDVNDRPIREVVAALEASINFLQGLIKENHALDVDYYDTFLNVTNVAMRKLAALALRLKLAPSEQQMISDLHKELEAINTKAKHQKALIPQDLAAAISQCKDGKQKQTLLVQLRKIGLQLITKEDGESLSKVWFGAKEVLKKALPPEPIIAATVPEERLTRDELVHGIDLQDTFLAWQLTNHLGRQALQGAVQNGLNGKFGSDIKDALEIGTLDQGQMIGLMLLDQLIDPKMNTDIPNLFVSQTEEEEKQEHTQVCRSNIDLAKPFNSLSKFIKETERNVEQIVQILINPTESQKDLAENEKQVLKEFNAILAQVRCDAKTFNAINKFLMWPIFDPVEFNKYSLQLDAYRARQLQIIE